MNYQFNSRQPYRIREIIPLGHNKNGRLMVYIKCVCGGEKIVRKSHVDEGKTTSCGCLYKETRGVATITHGNTRNRKATPTYRSWQNMTKRVNNPKSIQFKDYGGRGIKICRAWSKFENFLSDMGERPTGRSLDRINVNGNYEKKNCKWSTLKEQANNKRK